MQTKTCTKCNLEKSLDSFYKWKNTCKDCYNQNCIAYQQNNPEKKKEKDKKYRGSHKEEISTYYKNWYETTGKTQRIIKRTKT